MRGFSFQWRMAGRRKAACGLVLLFSAVVTVFMLIYPRLIDSTRQRLEEAYDIVEVSGWMINTQDYAAPQIPGADWYTLVESGYFSRHASYASEAATIFSKTQLETETGEEPGSDAHLLALQKQTYQMEKNTARAFGSMDACADLLRVSDSIRWLEGYSGDCLEGDEYVCLLSDRFGYEPGDEVPLLMTPLKAYKGDHVIRLTVVGVYPDAAAGFECALPLRTLEKMLKGLERELVIYDFVFTVADNRRIEDLKAFLTEMGYDGSGEQGVRAAIDDRILQGTVAPIRSNLALLEGLFAFFFVVIAVIGFFLCFLLARGRKPEYAIMRLLGESPVQITVKALLEQSALCLLGVILGGAVLAAAGQGSPDPVICGGIVGCYTLGAAVAVPLTVRVNVMKILRDKE